MTANPPAAGVPYYTPAQTPPAGTFLPTPSHPTPPTLFSPLTIRSVTLANRLAVAPMCMYSSPWTGHLTDFHLVHLGQFALHGSGLVMVEATAVQPRGRITPEDSGIWDDFHVAPLRRVADYIRSQGHVSAIQLAHAGRKASELAPWVQNERLHAAAVRAKNNGGVPEKVSMLATAEEGGWVDDVVGPSAIPLDDEHASPRELTLAEIDAILEDYKSAARRAVEAGFDVIEIHGAHGFLISSFLSPLSNKRTDKYGGSFENRTRLLFDVIAAIRSVIPATMPLFLRLSATEWMEHTSSEDYTTLDLATTIRIAKLLPAAGVDLLDVSSGGNSAAQKIPRVERYQIDLAKQIRAAVRDHARETGGERLLIAAVGRIASAALARDIVQQNEDGEADADLVFAAKQHLRDPAWVLNVAKELGVAVKWPHQYHRAEPRSTEL